MKLGSLTVSGRKFRLPCVYEFLRNGIVLYVGRSDAGFQRAFRGHSNGVPYPSAMRRVQAFNDCDEIRVTVFDNTAEARIEEVRLIELYKPATNVHHKRKQ
jgi:excinuclease UvrABC nuclease subunit